MLGEIDSEWYCQRQINKSTELFSCTAKDEGKCKENTGCVNRFRKWPTPEQFREEYGEDYPGEGAVYTFYIDYARWFVCNLKWAKEEWPVDTPPIVCACTPWGKPSDEWKPF